MVGKPKEKPAAVLVWYREKDLRVADHAPLVHAGEGAVPVFAGPVPERVAPRLGDLAARLEALGSGLVWLPGDPREELPRLAAHLGASAVAAHGFTEPAARLQEDRLAQALPCPLRLFPGETLAGPLGRHRVFTAFHRTFQREARLEAPLPAPRRLPVLPELPRWPAGPLLPLGLEPFLEDRLADYAQGRDRMDRDGTSRLSADLHFGRVSALTCWTEASGRPGAEAWQRQLVWREFAHHLVRAWPGVLEGPFQDAFRDFPWRSDPGLFRAWAEGRTGYPIVDAAARQLLATGYVHNRARMVAASFLAKHLLLDYRLGEAHYLAHLQDGDLANNSMGWQWSAGCGCDAQPWFRVFNPVLQGRRFDPEGAYVRAWVPELATLPANRIHSPWEGPLPAGYPPPIVDHAAAREAFLQRAKAHLRRSSSGS
ncbi:cryptochrome/photolyase family protein [Mesoterricola silvestris]|uniref:Deoxyribodipyrimidine photo-lyase n=1 Tax=Mesoterricola silvestris TaxID=2927979 RepID=A0AA48GTU3_9BACT|nr:deoxyribodipyrimidine photo-lyase [Mesoterricola silvestris]BDU73937.1 deoxyribodipyrimidine photo-lyase [Mesoterricola silvestris]